MEDVKFYQWDAEGLFYELEKIIGGYEENGQIEGCAEEDDVLIRIINPHDPKQTVDVESFRITCDAGGLVIELESPI